MDCVMNVCCLVFCWFWLVCLLSVWRSLGIGRLRLY